MRERAVKTGRKLRNKRCDEKPGAVSALKPDAGTGYHHTSSQIFHVLGDQKEVHTDSVYPWKPEVTGTGEPHRVPAPHEQRHVATYRAYNGVTQSEATSRESAARAASDALDPFHFDEDLDCTDEHPANVPPSPERAEDEGQE